MAADVVMPALGMNQDTGRLLQWLKREGETVTRGEPLMEVETDKATVEVEAPASGVLARVTALPGDKVPVGELLAVILAVGEADAADGAVPASPLARRTARERGIDVAAVAGSGPDGAVKLADLPRATSSPAGSRIWATMARRTAESWATVPHFYLEREVDASRLQSWRAHATRTNAGCTVTDLLVRLVAACLRRHPLVNGRWGGEGRVAADEIAIGIAVAVDDGLLVPVVRAADRLSLAEVSARRADLVERARAGRLRPDDLEGATFTISNLGMYAVDTFHGIVDWPQAAILAVGRIADRVAATDGGPRVCPSVHLSLSCDHRAVDGARAAAFLTDLGDLVEEPAALL
ncbi:MAG: 2-oxo acid dehydrogenase subunit E2 [Chloroflexi bacterium]|nr:MAG: 2-oxo acid dehydrogenase subunit E2 [Chloroflexota bacterium]